MDYGAIIGMISQLAGSAVAEGMSQMDKAEALRLVKSVSDEYGKIDIPALKQLVLEKMPDTKLAGIKDDPRYRDQQNSADAQLNDVISSGGLTLADRAALNSIRNRVSQTESAGRHAIEQGMAARGSLDSGAQLAMQLQGNQQAAQSASEAGERTAGAAQARAFDAIRQRAQNAGQGLDRDYRQQSDRARAQDAINAGNTAIANVANQYNASIPQRDFDNKMRKVAGSAAATYNTADIIAGQAKDKKQAAQGIANAAGQAASTGYDAYKSSNSGLNSTTNLGQKPDVVSVDVPKDFQQQERDYQGQGLSGQSTRTRNVVGHRLDGSPMYEDELR